MTRRVFYTGDPVPWFIARSTNNPAFHFDAAAGRHLVLSFFGTAAAEKSAAILRHIAGPLRSFLDDENIAFFGVSIDPADEKEARVRQSEPGIRYFWDFDRKVSTLYGAIDPDAPQTDSGVAYLPFTLVIDPALHVIATIAMSDTERHNEALTAVLRRLRPIAEFDVPAPILILPDLFERAFCRKLIDHYEQHGGVDSGFMRERDGNTVGVLDYGFKRRSDFRFDDAEEFKDLRAAVRNRINRRLVPELLKALQFKATRIERFVVACYEGHERGFFRAHRDNTTKGTAHRAFACTVNLNADEYDGGDLRFPEYGRRTYRAPTGGVVVFSCSLLHEALPVTKGRRYAFLPFLYDEAAAKIREENRKFITGEVIDHNAGALSGEQRQ